MAKQDTRTIEFMAFAGKATDPSHEGNVRRFAKFNNLDAMPLSEGLAAPAESPDGYDLLNFAPLTRNPSGPAVPPAEFGETVERRGRLSLLAAFMPGMRGNLFTTVQEGDIDSGLFATTEAAGTEGTMRHVYQEKWNTPPVSMVSRNTGSDTGVEPPDEGEQPEPPDPDPGTEDPPVDYALLAIQRESDGTLLPEWDIWIVNLGDVVLRYYEGTMAQLGEEDHTETFTFVDTVPTDSPFYLEVPVITDIEITDPSEFPDPAWLAANAVNAGVVTANTSQSGVFAAQVRTTCIWPDEDPSPTDIIRNASVIWFQSSGGSESEYDTRISWEPIWSSKEMAEVLEVVAASDIDPSDVIVNEVQIDMGSNTQPLLGWGGVIMEWGSIRDIYTQAGSPVYHRFYETLFNYQEANIQSQKDTLTYPQPSGDFTAVTGDAFTMLQERGGFLTATFLLTGQIGDGSTKSVVSESAVNFTRHANLLNSVPINEVAPYFYKARINRDCGDMHYSIKIWNRGWASIRIDRVDFNPANPIGLFKNPDGDISVSGVGQNVQPGLFGEVVIRFPSINPKAGALLASVPVSAEEISYSNPERPFSSDPINRIVYGYPAYEDEYRMEAVSFSARITVVEGTTERVLVALLPFVANGRDGWGVLQSHGRPDSRIVYIAIPRNRLKSVSELGEAEFSGIFAFGYQQGESQSEDLFVSAMPLNPLTLLWHPHHVITSHTFPIVPDTIFVDTSGVLTVDTRRNIYQLATSELPILDGRENGSLFTYGPMESRIDGANYYKLDSSSTSSRPGLFRWFSGGGLDPFGYGITAGAKITDVNNIMNLASLYDFSDVGGLP
jgi:hypothetical protein